MDIVNRHSVPQFVTKDTSTIREILAPANSCVARQCLAEAQLLPGKCTEAHSHPNTEEIYYILSGVGRMAIEDEIREVGPCDAVAISPGARHQILNAGVEPLVFLCCCVPAYSNDDTVMCSPLLDSLGEAKSS